MYTEELWRYILTIACLLQYGSQDLNQFLRYVAFPDFI